MTTYAGRPVFPAQFIDPYGNAQEGVQVTVYLRGTTTPATLYTDRTKATTTANPFTTDALGNAFPYIDPGEYDALVNGVTVPFSVLPDWDEPAAGLGAGAVANINVAAGAAIAQSKIAGLVADLAAKAPSTGIAQAAVTNLVSDLAGKQATIPPGTYVGEEPRLIVSARANGATALGVALEDDVFAAVLAKCGTRGVFRLEPGKYRYATGLVIPKGVIWDQDPAADLIYTGSGTAIQFEGGTLDHQGQDGTTAFVRVRRATITWPQNQGGTDTTSVGVRVRNVNSSKFRFHEIMGFHTGVEVHGDAGGVIGNIFEIGNLVNNKRSLVLRTTVVDGLGHVNQNVFIGGALRNDSDFTTAGVADVGTRWLVTGVTDGNLFLGTNLEGTPANVETAVEAACITTSFVGCRYEALAAGQFHFVSGSSRNRVIGGDGNFGPNAPFLDEGTENVIDGSRGTFRFSDGGTFGGLAAYIARALTSNGNKLFRGENMAGEEVFSVDGTGNTDCRVGTDAHPRVRMQNNAGPSGYGGVGFGRGNVAPDAFFGRTAGSPGLKASCPIIPQVTTTNVNTAGGVTIDPSTCEISRLNLAASIALAVLAGVENGQLLQIEFKQDAVGGRTVDLTAFFTNVAWNGAVPTLTTTADHLSILNFRYDTVLAKWLEVSRALDIG